MTNPTDPDGKIEQPRNSWMERDGLTKREYFAAMAMQGFVAGIHAFPDPKVLLHWKSEGMAIYCLQIADALIAKLNKK